MLAPEQAKRQAIIKEIYIGIIGWAWVAASVAALYFLAGAVFYGRPWWHLFGAVIVAWVLYRISLRYQLETERTLREAAKAQEVRRR